MSNPEGEKHHIDIESLLKTDLNSLDGATLEETIHTIKKATEHEENDYRIYFFLGQARLKNH